MEARNRPLHEWFGRIRSGQIVLPRFQRFEEWGPGEVAALLQSVLRDLPVGATLVLEVGDREPFVSRLMAGAPAPTERITEHLLDGQQRLTALWKSLNEMYPDRTYFAYFAEGEEGEGDMVPYVQAQARWEKSDRRYPLWADEPAEMYQRGLIPFYLLHPDDISKQVRDFCDEATGAARDESRDLEDRIRHLRQKVQFFNIPFLGLPPSVPAHVALDVFIKTNTTSVKLTPFDIVVAQVEEATQQSLHDLVGELKLRVPAIAVYTEPESLVLDASCLRQDRPSTQASYQRLNLHRMVDEWDQVIEGIKRAVDILEHEHIFDQQRLPTVSILPVLVALWDFIPTSGDELGNARGLLRRYMWRAFLTRRYENAATTRAIQDFRGLRALLQGQEDAYVPILDEEQYPLPTLEELEQAGWPKAKDILARGILAVSLQTGALDLADATPATRTHLQQREYHHLFPAHLLEEDGGMPAATSNKALNCALVTWQTNRRISAKEPLRYLQERVQSGHLGVEEIKSRLKSHVIPFNTLSVGGYDENANVEERVRQDYTAFIHERAQLMSEAIRNLCDGRRWPA